MLDAPLHEREDERIAKLRSYSILDTDPESAFDDLSKLASRICGTPIALVSFVDKERQWFKSRVGIQATETPREFAFCAHAILRPDDVLVVEDATKDRRFRDNPLVTGGPRVAFYAGVPLVEPGGLPLGTLCVIDDRPRQIGQQELDSLRILARHVCSQLELRRTCNELHDLSGQLQRSNRELEDFSRVAAHDLQEPLRKIISFGELLRLDLGAELNANAAEDLGYMTDAAERMRQLIHRLLQLSQAGRDPLRLQPVDIAECVAAARCALSARIDETFATITVESLPTVDGDPTLLTQLFQNLISNAIKFVRDGRPVVRVTCVEEQGEVVLGVLDNGIGIEPRARHGLFQSCQRLNPVEFDGSGIGLSIVRKVVERHGGRIWVESHPGQGSHFRFVLPGARLPVGSLVTQSG